MRRAILPALAGLAMAGTATAADFETPITLPRDAQIDVTVSRTRSGTGAPTPMTMVFRYRQDIQPKGDGYVVRQRMTGIDYPPGLSEADKAQTAAVASTVADLSYEADESLTPVRINDWQALVERLGGAGADENSRRVAAGVRQLYGRMSPEAAARALLREQQFPAAPQGTSLDLGTPVSEPTQSANPFGGQPIAGVYRIELQSLDKAAGRAVIRISSKHDPESASRSVRESLQAMAATMPDAPKPTAEQLAALRIDRSLDCRHEMDLKTGLAVTSDCTQTVTGSDENMRPRTQSDRWVITQSLVAR